MLFKVFTVLGAISLLGGFANCQLFTGNQNDQLTKFLVGLMSGTADGNKNSNENLFNQLLLNSIIGEMKNVNQEEQAIQTLIKMLGSGTDAAKSNDYPMMQFLLGLMNGNKDKSSDNQLMQLLAMMMGGNTEPTYGNEDQIMKFLALLMGGAKDTAKMNENQMMQFLAGLLGSGKDSTKMYENQMMQFLLKAMFGGATDNKKNNENQMMQMLLTSMLGGAKDKTKNNGLTKSMKDSLNALSKMFPGSGQTNKWLNLLGLVTDDKKKPAQCMAVQNMGKNDDEFGASAWLEMLKTDSLKELFGSSDDYMKFNEMVEYIDGNRKTDWLGTFFKSVKGNDWIMAIVEQILSMVENDKTIQNEIMKFIQGDKELREFTLSAIEWLEIQNFSDSSPMLQKVANILMGMEFKEPAMDEAWFDKYMNWVDCTFSKDGEISSVMKTLGMLSKADFMKPFLKNMLGNYTKEKKIEFTLQLRGVCSKKFKLPQQSLLDILNYVVSEKLFCTVKSFTTAQRDNIVSRQRGTYISSVVGIPYYGSVWVVQISRDGRVVEKDVDVNYVPKNGDLIEVYKYA